MDSDQFPISDVAVQIISETTDVNSYPSSIEVLPQVPPVSTPDVPVFASTIVQSSFGRPSENSPMVVTIIQSN